MRKRITSLLLTLVMLLSLVPAMGQVAYAYSEGDIAGTTGSGASKEDPVVCDTFAEFKAAMENTEITYVKLTGASGAMPSRETFGAAISNTTYKVLTIEGTNRFWSPLNGDNDCLIWPRNELTINGTGTLKYEHGNTGGTGAVINMASNVSLKIDGNVTLEGGANGKSYGYAISAQAGTTKINGGSFIGYSASINDNADVSAVIINSSANLTINGGNFSASLHQNSPEGKKAHSLTITSTATGAISIKEGTFPQGINIKARGKTIENCGYFDTAKASITADGNAVATTASTDVLNGKNVVVTDTSIIASVAVAVTEPVAGAQPQDAVSNTANVSVSTTAWYHNGVKMLATDTFAAGETYKVHVIVKPNSGYEFADNPTATFNGSTAGTIYMYGKDYINYYAEFTVPAASTPTTIDTVAISVTAPTAGAAPVVEPAGLPTGVTCEPVLTTVTGWYDSETNTKMASTEKFVEGKTYYICLFLSADTGYAFANPVTTATINGVDATIELNNDGYLAIKKSFVASASATTIDTIAVTVTVPVAGAAPVVEPAGLPTGVTCEPVLTTVTGWYDSETNTKMASTEKFVEGKTYYICLFLSADTGYAFANPVTTATINGVDATIELNNDGYLAIKKSFVATAAATTEYDITVTDGKATIGAGTEISKAAEGTTVTLTANDAPSSQVFDKWVVVSGSITLADANSATTTFTMPAEAVSVKATYKTTPVTTYNLTTQVNGGHGTISASKTGLTAGSTETITFNPEVGYEIDTVTVNGTATSVSGNTLNVTMNENKTVVVTYKAIEYNITVTDGKATIGAGSEISKAAEGTAVTLTANAAPSGKVFDKWEVVSGGITLADANSATTTFTMPASAVSVKATYKNITYTGGGSGGGGGSSHSSRYAITVDKTENGTITVSPKSASKGDTVTITVKPDKGYELEMLKALDKDGDALKLTEKNGKYTFKMPSGKVTVKGSFVEEAPEQIFKDVPVDAYYYEAVKWAAEKGITGGIGNGLFGPNQPCTRAQIVTFLWRAAGSPAPKHMSSFADVPADAFYAKAVAWAVENGITGGTGDGKFSPDATCTRAQSVTFLYRAAGSPKVSGSAEFGDVATNAYYADAVAWAAKNGITGGIGGGLFGSNNNCTRAQIVTFLYRAMK